MTKAVLFVVVVLFATVALSACGTTAEMKRDEQVLKYDRCMKEFHSYVVCDEKVGQVIR